MARALANLVETRAAQGELQLDGWGVTRAAPERWELVRARVIDAVNTPPAPIQERLPLYPGRGRLAFWGRHQVSPDRYGLLVTEISLTIAINCLLLSPVSPVVLNRTHKGGQ